MARKRRHTPRSAVELAQSTRSDVAFGMIQRGSAGAGKHGGTARAQIRRDRQGARRALRRGDVDV